MLLAATRLAPIPAHGIGLYADTLIAKGTPVWRFFRGFGLELPLASSDISPEARTNLALQKETLGIALEIAGLPIG
jgi:hypothetical protein